MSVLDTDFDSPEKLLRVVGSFWRNVYEGSDFVESALHGRAQLDAQAHLWLLDLIASMSRYTVPVFHTRNWTLLRLLESQKDATEIATYGGAAVYAEGTTLKYSVPRPSDLHAWALPTGFRGAKVILNRITDASLTLVEGVDFTIDDGVVRFAKNPFDDERAGKRELLKDNTVVDREVGLWAYHGEWDWDTVHRQYGYAIGLRLKSSEGYKELVNAVYDALVKGTTAASVEAAFSAICGIPLARVSETIEDVWEDDRRLWIATDKNVYQFPPTVSPTVAVGQAVGPGEPLTDGLRFFDLNRGHRGISGGLKALVLGRGVLAGGFYQDLMFEDKDVPLLVEHDADGLAKVSWELAGFPGDVAAFFDRMHADGVSRGQTLANLLDTRPADAREGEPTAAALPATINPLKFLTDNVLRNNAFVVRVRPAEFGPNALGLGVAAQVLRRVIPPQTLCFVVAELSVSDAQVSMGAPGNDEAPGGTEAVNWFTGAKARDNLSQLAVTTELVTETVRARQIAGRCE